MVFWYYMSSGSLWQTLWRTPIFSEDSGLELTKRTGNMIQRTMDILVSEELYIPQGGDFKNRCNKEIWLYAWAIWSKSKTSFTTKSQILFYQIENKIFTLVDTINISHLTYPTSNLLFALSSFWFLAQQMVRN